MGFCACVAKELEQASVWAFTAACTVNIKPQHYHTEPQVSDARFSEEERNNVFLILQQMSSVPSSKTNHS